MWCWSLIGRDTEGKPRKVHGGGRPPAKYNKSEKVGAVGGRGYPSGREGKGDSLNAPRYEEALPVLRDYLNQGVWGEEFPPMVSNGERIKKPLQGGVAMQGVYRHAYGRVSP